VEKLEEKRQKAIAEAQQYETELLQYKKDQEMQAALKLQELEFAKRTAADSQVAREREICVCVCVILCARANDKERGGGLVMLREYDDERVCGIERE
jgi:hypothetical protein